MSLIQGGISARGDLNAVNGTYEVESMGFRDHAGLDYKVEKLLEPREK